MTRTVFICLLCSVFVSSAFAQPSPKNKKAFEEWLMRGDTAYKAHNYNNAFNYYSKAVELNPINENALVGKANALWGKGKYNEALSYFESVLATNPQNKEAWAGKGGVLLTKDDDEDAITCFDKALAIDSLYDKAWRRKADALLAQKKYDEAFACCNKALAINPYAAENWVMKGVFFSKLKIYNEALSYSEKALSIDSTLPSAINGKGNALYDLKRYSEAIPYFDYMLEIRADEWRVWYNKAIMLEAVEDYQQSLVCLDKSIQLYDNYGDNSESFKYKGWVLYKLNRYPEALSNLDSAINKTPDDAEAFNFKGVVYEAMNNNDEAMECYNKSIHLNKDYFYAWYNKANMLRGKNNAEAVFCLDVARNIRPTDPKAYNLRGVLYTTFARKATREGEKDEKVDFYRKALSDFNRSLELDGSNETVQSNRKILQDEIKKRRINVE